MVRVVLDLDVGHYDEVLARYNRWVFGHVRKRKNRPEAVVQEMICGVAYA
jgi:hypothetical protein